MPTLKLFSYSKDAKKASEIQIFWEMNVIKGKNVISKCDSLLKAAMQNYHFLK